MYKVYGTLIFVHGLDLGTSGREPNNIFTSLKYLMMLLKCTSFRASFLHAITDTNSMYGHEAQLF